MCGSGEEAVEISLLNFQIKMHGFVHFYCEKLLVPVTRNRHYFGYTVVSYDLYVNVAYCLELTIFKTVQLVTQTVFGGSGSRGLSTHRAVSNDH